MEVDLIEKEEREINQSKDEENDSEEMRDLYMEMYGDES
jgi:hypothetical protein